MGLHFCTALLCTEPLHRLVMAIIRAASYFNHIYRLESEWGCPLMLEIINIVNWLFLFGFYDIMKGWHLNILTKIYYLWSQDEFRESWRQAEVFLLF